MKEIRAVVVGLFVVILVAVAIAYWRRPSRDLKRIGGYHVEIEKSEGGARKHVSFTVPIGFIARVAGMVPVSDFGGNWKTEGGDEVTPRDILDAADKSAPGKPGVITHDRATIEVTADGPALEITAKDDWDRNVRVRVPRALVESLSSDRRISARDILKKLDELGPGDVVVIRDRNDQVTITAEPR